MPVSTMQGKDSATDLRVYVQIHKACAVLTGTESLAKRASAGAACVTCTASAAAPTVSDSSPATQSPPDESLRKFLYIVHGAEPDGSTMSPVAAVNDKHPSVVGVNVWLKSHLGYRSGSAGEEWYSHIL